MGTNKILRSNCLNEHEEMENHEINEHDTINDLKNYCRNEYGTNDTQEDKDFIDNMGNEQSNGYNLRPCPTK